ncbi:MAG: hypothetical protein AB7K09_19515 [Planctomycetota bacterium]
MCLIVFVVPLIPWLISAVLLVVLGVSLGRASGRLPVSLQSSSAQKWLRLARVTSLTGAGTAAFAIGGIGTAIGGTGMVVGCFLSLLAGLLLTALFLGRFVGEAARQSEAPELLQCRARIIRRLWIAAGFVACAICLVVAPPIPLRTVHIIVVGLLVMAGTTSAGFAWWMIGRGLELVVGRHSSGVPFARAVADPTGASHHGGW